MFVAYVLLLFGLVLCRKVFRLTLALLLLICADASNFIMKNKLNNMQYVLLVLVSKYDSPTVLERNIVHAGGVLNYHTRWQCVYIEHSSVVSLIAWSLIRKDNFI